MANKHQTFIVATAQAAPVFLDRAATVEKACDLIASAAREGARLIVFPEGFIPTYPNWVWVVPAGDWKTLHRLHAELLANSVAIPGDATDRLCRTARQARIYVAMGLNELNTEASGSSLYNTLLYIDADGHIIGRHRKLVPTGGERLVWAQGDGSTLQVYDTPLGKIGGLICWENYMPLARYAMYAWGTQIYIAATWDQGEPWLSTLRHIAKEGRVYCISCSIAMRKDHIPDRYDFKQQYYEDAQEWINVGDSAIVDPAGDFIAGPVKMKEEILYAEIDPALTGGLKWNLDVAGHYARPDVFHLTISRQLHPILQIKETASGPDEDIP